MPLSGKNVLLTGATGGLGEAIARELALQGCNLFLTGRNRSALESLMAKVSSAAGHLRSFEADLQDDTSIRLLIDQVTAAGGVDVLVNCAGVFPVGNIGEATVEEFDQCFAVNVRAPFILCRAFLPGMVARKWGRVVNIGSSSAFSGFKHTAIYCASKHALLGLSRALFDEMRSQNVRVISLHPGSIRTEMGARVPEQDFSTFLDPADVAKYLVFVISFDSELVSEEIRLNRLVLR